MVSFAAVSTVPISDPGTSELGAIEAQCSDSMYMDTGALVDVPNHPQLTASASIAWFIESPITVETSGVLTELFSMATASHQVERASAVEAFTLATHANLGRVYVLAVSDAIAFSTSGATEVNLAKLLASEFLSLSAEMGTRIRYTAKDAIVLTSITSADLIYILREVINLEPYTDATLETLDSLSETIRFGTALGFAASILARDGFTVEDNSEYAVYRILAVSEALRLSTGVGTTLEIATKLYEALAFIENIDFINSLEASDLLGFADQLSIALSTRLEAADALAFVDTLGKGITVITSVSEELDLTDQDTLTLSALFRASESIIFAGNVPLGDEDYEMWVVNTTTIGASQYTNTPFNSMASAREKTYGLTETGLYELTGDDDDGTLIEAAVQTGLLDFGTHDNKAIARAYLYVGSGDHVYLRTISSRLGERNSQWYEIIPRDGDDVQPRRVRLARGVKSVTWGFEVKNIDGGSLDLRYLDAVPVVLRRRR